MLHGMCEECARTTWLNDNWLCWRCEKIKGDKMNVNEKETFVDMLMKILLAIDLDGVAKDKDKEHKMRAELLTIRWEAVNDYFNKANEILQMQCEIEKLNNILEEINAIGADAVKEKYGIV